MIIKANSFYMPLKTASVQAIITSPPYWSLRRYDIQDIEYNDWSGQLGLENTPGRYIKHLRAIMKECWRILKDNGVCFINLGDTYGGSWGNFGARTGQQRERKSAFYKRRGQPEQTYKPPTINCKPKSLCLIPERFVIVCQFDGWIIRNSIIWHKPNAMPSSVKDRFTVSHEKIYMTVKQEKYYFDLDAVRVPYVENSDVEYRMKIRAGKKYKTKSPYVLNTPFTVAGGGHPNLKGKNPGDMWTINTQPYPEAHYATFPEKLVDRMVLCATKPGDIVCDPFAGSGTTLKVALKHKRKAVGLDLGYHTLQKKSLSTIMR